MIHPSATFFCTATIPDFDQFQAGLTMSAQEHNAQGVDLLADIWAVEPRADVAALGSMDSQEASQYADAFEDFCEQTTPVRLCLTDFAPRKKFPVFIYSQDGVWVPGSAELVREGARDIWIQSEKPIKGGASGGPVVTESGELIGVISFVSEQEPYDGSVPRLHLTLPCWVVQKVLKAQW